MSENKTGKYLKYALGEILLVMIGILLALQVNNWNEEKKLKKLEKAYLIGILDDLRTDTTSINGAVLPNFRENHRGQHQYLDSLVRNDLLTNEAFTSEAAAPVSLTFSGLSFYPTVGTYNAMISQGNTGLIQDKTLFNAIQMVYEVWYERNNEAAQRRDKIMDDIRLKYTYNFTYDTKIEQVQNKPLLADLNLMYHTKRRYVELVNEIEREIVTIIKEIEKQLRYDKIL